MSLTLKIITGMILGFLTGLFINILSLNNYDFISTYFVGGLFDIIGSIFISSLKLMVVPLVFFSLSTGVASFDKDKKLSLIAFKTISLYLLTTAVAISLGLLAAIIFSPGVEILYAMPYLIFVIILMVVFGRNIYFLFIAIGAVEWLTMARIVRGQTISLKEKEFIETSKALGQSNSLIIIKHIIPNLAGPIIVYITLMVPSVIILESFLSFLGLGVQEPLTSWGSMPTFFAISSKTLISPISFDSSK